MKSIIVLLKEMRAGHKLICDKIPDSWLVDSILVRRHCMFIRRHGYVHTETLCSFLDTVCSNADKLCLYGDKSMLILRHSMFKQRCSIFSRRHGIFMRRQVTLIHLIIKHPNIDQTAYTAAWKNTINLHIQVFLRINTELFETHRRQYNWIKSLMQKCTFC